MQEAINLMRFRLPIDVIAQSIYIHPALPEVMQAAFGAVARQVSETRGPHAHEEHERVESHEQHGG